MTKQNIAVQDFLSWREEWRVGIPMVDRQHRVLADCLNRLVKHYSLEASADQESGSDGRRQLGQLLDELYATAREHFRREEALMLGLSYPGYGSHLREHAMLLAELKSTFLNRFTQSWRDVDAALLSALRSWFISHVLRSDREFADYLLVRPRR
jgi:hemerythrin